MAKNRSACYNVQNFAAQDNIKVVGSLSCKTEPLDRTCETQPPIYSTVWCVFFFVCVFFCFFFLSAIPYCAIFLHDSGGGRFFIVWLYYIFLGGFSFGKSA